MNTTTEILKLTVTINPEHFASNAVIEAYIASVAARIDADNIQHEMGRGYNSAKDDDEPAVCVHVYVVCAPKPICGGLDREPLADYDTDWEVGIGDSEDAFQNELKEAVEFIVINEFEALDTTSVVSA